MTITEREYSIAEVARHLRVSEPTLRHAIKLERLPIVRRAGRIKITPDGIDRYLRRQVTR